VTADVITIVTQVVGAAMIGVSQSKLADGEVPPITAEQANDILRAGLAVQVFSLTIFLSLLAVLVVRISKHRRSATAESMDTPATSTTTVSLSRKSRIPLLLTVLTLSTVFIYIRTVFRLIEAAMGVESSATLNQGLFTALETVPVYVAVILWTVFPLHVLF
jgi:heme/copper-type cytochrome/quinol oxidase subunit 2